MGSSPGIRTERLLLRRWRESDFTPFSQLNSDPRVMEHFPGLLSREESDMLARRSDQHFDECGFGRWAVEIPGVTLFAGFIGLSIPQFRAHFTPCVEIGWRMARQFWGQGYATEGAVAALRYGFDELKLGEIASFTVPANFRSRRVMERLGMRHDPSGDFEHPLLPVGHPLRLHVLYRINHEPIK